MENIPYMLRLLHLSKAVEELHNEEKRLYKLRKDLLEAEKIDMPTLNYFNRVQKSKLNDNAFFDKEDLQYIKVNKM